MLIGGGNAFGIHVKYVNWAFTLPQGAGAHILAAHLLDCVAWSKPLEMWLSCLTLHCASPGCFCCYVKIVLTKIPHVPFGHIWQTEVDRLSFGGARSLYIFPACSDGIALIPALAAQRCGKCSEFDATPVLQTAPMTGLAVSTVCTPMLLMSL